MLAMNFDVSVMEILKTASKKGVQKVTSEIESQIRPTFELDCFGAYRFAVVSD